MGLKLRLRSLVVNFILCSGCQLRSSTTEIGSGLSGATSLDCSSVQRLNLKGAKLKDV